MSVNKFLRFFVLSVTIIVFTSCVTMADYDFSVIDNSLKSGEYEDVYQQLEADENILYSKKDKVLSDLDKGLVSHYAKEFNRSNDSLSSAEKLIFKNFTKSISQSISSFMINDLVIDYAGETYEDIYANLFMALNYIHLGKTEDAFVEIRRFDNKLKSVSAQYSDLIVQANNQNLKNGSKTVENPKVEFHNSALARYLSLILYRSIGKMDSARIDKRYLENAFALQPKLYNFSVPSCVEEEFSVPEGKSRLNIIAFSGRAPIKEEEFTAIYSDDSSFLYQLALPVMNKTPSSIAGAKIEVYSLDGKLVASSSLEKIESLESIAIDTFKQKSALLYLKAITRSILKTTSNSMLNEMSESSEDAGVAMFFSVLHFASSVKNVVTERADVRSSRFFPATAWVTGINVPDGKYSVKIIYKSASGSSLWQETQQITVDSNQLNLVESICLR